MRLFYGPYQLVQEQKGVLEPPEPPPGYATGIRKFCPLRWTVRGGAIKSILENYDVLNQLWEECLEERLEPDVKGRIIGA